MSETIRTALKRLASEQGDREAIIFENQTVTYNELNQRALEFGSALDKAGLAKGERVAALLPNSIEWLIAYLGTAASGRIFVGLNTWFTGKDLTYVLQKCEAKTLIYTGTFRSHDYNKAVQEATQNLKLDRLIGIGEVNQQTTSWSNLLTKATGEPQHNPEPEDPALIVYTSGSTGLPKGVVLHHGPLLTNGKHIGDRQHITKEDRLWLASPLFFSYGCANAVMVVLSHGATLILQQIFDPKESLELLSKKRATIYYATTNMTYALRDELAKTPQELTLRTGTAIGTPAQLRAAAELAPGICNIYGMTETYGNCAVTDADDPLETRLNTEGKPLPDHTITIIDPETEKEVPTGELGEIRVGGLITTGYYNDPERTKQAFDNQGRLRTGDLGRLDKEGRLTWESRIGDLIKTAGVNVSAAEVERVLEQDPRIRQVYVVGVPDETRGEVIAAVVEPATQDLTEQEVIKAARQALASYKVPRIVQFRTSDEFPTTSTGKVSRKDLTTQVAKAYKGDANAG